MTGIHDVFPADEDDDEDPISLKKLKQGEGEYSTRKTLLGFDFDGVHKTMWLEEAKREKLITVLKGWIRTASREHEGSILQNSDLSYRKYDTHLRAFPKVWHYCHHATGY